MSKYDVTYEKLAVLLMPMCFRVARLMAVARLMVKPVGRLHGELVEYREETRAEMSYNSQTCRLEAVLNKKFDPVGRRIRINENDSDADYGILLHERGTGLFTLTWPRAEAGSDGSKAVTVYRRGYGGAQRYGFWVVLPMELQGTVSEEEVRAVTNRYKLASIRYGVVYRV